MRLLCLKILKREISIINIKNGKEKSLFKAKNPLQEYNIGSTEFLTLKSG